MVYLVAVRYCRAHRWYAYEGQKENCRRKENKSDTADFLHRTEYQRRIPVESTGWAVTPRKGRILAHLQGLFALAAGPNAKVQSDGETKQNAPIFPSKFDNPMY